MRSKSCDKAGRLRDELNRRDFLRAGALGVGTFGLALGSLAHAADRKPVNCILINLVGGPSQLDTWDLKPDAPESIRGPFRPIKTNVSGIEICEHFPRMATMADRYAIVRSVHHHAAPIHETGHQLMQTGQLFRNREEHPHYGSVLSASRGKTDLPPFVVLPTPLGHTGVSVSHGQGAGYLGAAHEPFLFDGDVRRASRLRETTIRQAFDITAENEDLRTRYGRNTFGQSCLLARRLVEQGVGLVTVNMFETVFNELSWDCHADGGSLAVTLDDYRDILCPMFDVAYSALLEDLHQRGLLENTLVLAMGEFGRTPHLNPRGGRDHWPGVWSILFAGGGIRGGQVIGSSDAHGAEPKDRPVTPAEVAATVFTSLGIDPKWSLRPTAGRMTPLCASQPIAELFR